MAYCRGIKLRCPPSKTAAGMKSKSVALLQRLSGWRLSTLFALFTVIGALLIVSAMDLILMGRITADYLLTGLVAAGIIAPISLSLLSQVLRELARQAIAETGASAPADMGKVMKAMIAKVAGRAPGDQVSAAVRELLQK